MCWIGHGGVRLTNLHTSRTLGIGQKKANGKIKNTLKSCAERDHLLYLKRLKEATLATAIAPLGGVAVRNTRNLLTEASKFCMLIYAPAKRGKTTFAATMDGFTKK